MTSLAFFNDINSQDHTDISIARNLKQWWSIISPISTILTKTSDIKSLNVEKAITFDVGNPDPSLKHVPKRSGVKPVDEISTPSW